MRISFYGSLAEAIGREVEWPLSSGTTVADVREALARLHPSATLDRQTVRACLDDAIVDDSHKVAPGATLAFFPPLSGG